MGTARTWMTVGAILLAAAGIYTMGTEVGSAQWIVGLVLVVLAGAAGVALLMTRRSTGPS